MNSIREARDLLKGYSIRKTDHRLSDQQRKVPQPPLVKPVPQDAVPLVLPDPNLVHLLKTDIRNCIRDRVSHRKFSSRPMTLEQLSFLLWATQGVKSVSKDRYFTKRTVPSAGARHPFETYLAVFNVRGLETGIYRYLPLRHQLLFSHPVGDLKKSASEAACRQKFCGETAVLFGWAVIPYRSEWRYTDHAMKAVILDAGHVGQNLYLASEAIGAGTCGVGAYIQEWADELFGLDGEDEFIIYLAPVGFPLDSNSANRIY